MKSILKLFEELGFKPSTPPASWAPEEVAASEALLTGIHVFGKAEPWNAGKDHFRPTFRIVSVLGPNGGTPDNPKFYYVTSNIRGVMRRYRCRNVDTDAQVCNIFASGPTQRKAVENWIREWKQHMSTVKPRPRMETPKEAGYQFVRYKGPRQAVFKDIETEKEELWYANKGHSSAGIRFNNTDWEFGSSTQV